MLRQPQQTDHQTDAATRVAAPITNGTRRRRHTPSWGVAQHGEWERGDGDAWPPPDLSRETLEAFLGQEGYCRVYRGLNGAPRGLDLYAGPTGYVVVLQVGTRLEVVQTTGLPGLLKLLDELTPLLRVLP
jgi:hypothetical protein